MSGTFLKPELIGKLEELWAEHLLGLPQSDGRFSRGEAAPAGVPMTDDLDPRLNAEITDNDVLLFDTGLRLSQHIAELAEARTVLGMAEHCRMYSNGQSWDEACMGNLAVAIEKFTDVTLCLDELRDRLGQLMQDVCVRSDLTQSCSAMR